ncbi:MAG TPA: phage/plasmid primase, P4 family [Sedimentisphaerales bacterium]|nr:phage/plasmid primase, P4 family [Sedimentisphaerales bacterium]
MSTQQESFYTDSDHLALGVLSSNFVYDPGGPSLQGGAYTLRAWRGDFYIWREGHYVRISDDEVKRLITQHIQALNGTSISDTQQQIAVTSQRINNIMLCLKGRIGIPEQTELNSWPDGREQLITTIAVKNGLVMLDGRGGRPVLVNHTPDYFTLTKLPYDYDPAAKCELWESFLNDVMLCRSEYILLLQQWAGYLFRSDLREQKFLLCCGEGANGKGVFFEVVSSLVGKENCSEVPLSRFSHPFALYGTLGKMVNMTNESSHIITDDAETMLKSFVAGDRLTFERKFKEQVSAKPTAKVMIATNALPRFNDKTQGIWRRILLVPFDKVIPEEEQIKDLADQRKRELPGILNWALAGLEKLNKAGRFTIPEHSSQLIEEYRRDADPARAFLLENYTYAGNGDKIGCSALYEQYKQYCLDNGNKAMSNRTFGQQVKRVFPKVQRVRSGGRDDREWVYQGLVSQGAEQQYAFSG